MQWIYSMVTLLIIHIIGTAALIEDGENPSCACSPNSSFVQCGDYCERSCGWYSGEPRGCSIKRCAPRGCYCDFGYARNAVGICIIAEECCNTATEEYLSCGADCPETCENSAEDIAKDPGCGLYCISGCFCKNGLVRRSDGLCVNPGKCFRSKCDPALGEVYRSCGSACPKTCERPDDRPCTEQCVTGCFCPNDQLRRKDGKCVAVKETCDIICGINEVYKPCGISCPETCPPIRPCADHCLPGCACIDGFVRNEHRACVPTEWCGRCGPNEVYYPASSDPCPPRTCDEYCYNDPPYGQTAAGCPAGCRCKPGYVLNDAKCCVLED